MKILILGGTGAMGSHLTKILADNGEEVYVTSRRSHKSNLKINYFVGNAQDDSFLKQILNERWDTIVDFMVYSTTSFKRRVELLLNATDQYIYLSSARVYANSKEAITEKSPRLLDVTKDSEFLSTDEYALSKARQEDLLINSNKKNWTIIRPYITYSEERLQLGVLEKEAWLYRALHNRPIVFSSDIYPKVSTLTYGLDVAKSISAIIGEKGALGQAFHITNPNSITWKEVLAIYTNVLSDHLGSQPEVLLQNVEDFNKWHMAEYQVKYDRLYDRKFDNRKIGQYVDTSNFVDATTGLRNCLQTFLASPDFLRLNWQKEAVKDRQVNVRASLKEQANLKQRIKYLIYRNLPI